MPFTLLINKTKFKFSFKIIFSLLSFFIASFLAPVFSEPAYDVNNSNKDSRLCKENEKIVHSFITVEKKKIVSICIQKFDKYMVYRFGSSNKIGKYVANKVEFSFPENTAKSFSQFTYSYFLRGGWKQNSGLDLNYLKFTNKGFIYLIYDEYDAESASRSIGIKVLNPKTKKEVDMKGDPKTLKGTMLHFRDYDEIIKAEVDPER